MISYRIRSGCVSFLFTLALALLMPGCTEDHDKNKTLSDKPIKEFQAELLDLAFNSASKIPVEPHIKDRSRIQQHVVETCLKLGQAKTSLQYTELIENWRKGLCYAHIAHYCAQNSMKNHAEIYIQKAALIAQKDHGQAWRNDRIKAKIAQTHTILGQDEKAEQFSENLEESETGKAASAQAAVTDEQNFDKTFAALDELISRGIFDISKNALFAYAKLFDRFYQDQDKRSEIENKIKNSWTQMPVFIRIDLLAEMAETALANDNKAHAAQLLDSMQNLVDEHDWKIESLVPLTAKIVKLRFKAGDSERAAKHADKVLDEFKNRKEEIINMFRPEAVTPLAEAYQSMGDTQKALEVYSIAVEESVVNINSRPRAEDLAEICCSMAVYEVKPDEKLMGRMNEIYSELSWP